MCQAWTSCATYKNEYFLYKKYVEMIKKLIILRNLIFSIILYFLKIQNNCKKYFSNLKKLNTNRFEKR